MGWIAALVTIPALIMLGALLWHPEGDKGWRDQARRTSALVIRDPRRPGVGGVELIAENGGGLNEEALKQLFQK